MKDPTMRNQQGRTINEKNTGMIKEDRRRKSMNNPWKENITDLSTEREKNED